MIDLTPIQNDPPLQTLVGQLRALIRDARSRFLRSVDAIQVRTCWEIGRHIVEFEQGGAARAEYGKRLLPRLVESLIAEFGRGFDERNLRNMRAFFQVFPIWDAVRTELSWTHYLTPAQAAPRIASLLAARKVRTQFHQTNALGRASGFNIKRPR